MTAIVVQHESCARLLQVQCAAGQCSEGDNSLLLSSLLATDVRLDVHLGISEASHSPEPMC